MLDVSGMSLQRRLLIALLLAVLASTTIVGTTGYFEARNVLAERLQKSDLPNLVLRIRNAIDREINGMKTVTRSIANNSMLLHWLESGADAEGEKLLVEYLGALARENDLSNASFADRDTARYWNQDGFLRQLKNDNLDGWFFAFKNSGKSELASTYAYPDGHIDVFVNFQQVNGRGLAGVSRSFDDIVTYLQKFQLEESGFVYLVDAEGTVQVHKDPKLNNTQSLADLYPKADVSSLLNNLEFAYLETNGQIVASSFVPSLGWYVIAQVPRAELYAAVDTVRNNMMVWMVVILAVFAVIGTWLASSLTQPIKDIASMFRKIGDGEGDLRYRLDETGSNELAQLGGGFNSFIVKIHKVVSDVANTSNILHQAAGQVSSGAGKTRSDSEHQRDETMMVATAMHEMGTTIEEIARNAAQAAVAAGTADQSAANALNVVSDSSETISQMAVEMDSVVEVIESLAGKSDAIGSVLDVIRAVSEQTNLLALNAAIEAARAGEQGRGFAVVADEVRNLARRTNDSAEEIQRMINELQEEAQHAVSAAQNSRTQASAGSEAAQRTSIALEEIVEQIRAIADVNTQVATATEQQSSVVNEINTHVTEISDSTERNTKSAADMASASQRLNDLANNLEQLVGRFKL